jgi:hypothetical protein
MDMAMNRIFRYFRIIRVSIGPLLPFEPFRFWLRIRGDIRNRKSTPRLGESGSRYDESGSRYSNFFKFCVDFNNFKRLDHALKGPIWQKISQGCNVLSLLIYLKGLKKG